MNYLNIEQKHLFNVFTGLLNPTRYLCLTYFEKLESDNNLQWVWIGEVKCFGMYSNLYYLDFFSELITLSCFKESLFTLIPSGARIALPLKIISYIFTSRPNCVHLKLICLLVSFQMSTSCIHSIENIRRNREHQYVLGFPFVREQENIYSCR